MAMDRSDGSQVSVLAIGPTAQDGLAETSTQALKDLNLDQVISAVTAGRAEYDLVPLLCQPVRAVETIAYRQEVARDLERKDVSDAVRQFSRMMVTTRTHLRQAGRMPH